MSQRNVEIVIGRLVTDEELRLRLTRAPLETLESMAERGCELTRGEIAALLEIDITLWSRIAARLPSRLQRCSLKADTGSGEYSR
jgi:hypothetical protein